MAATTVLGAGSLAIGAGGLAMQASQKGKSGGGGYVMPPIPIVAQNVSVPEMSADEQNYNSHIRHSIESAQHTARRMSDYLNQNARVKLQDGKYVPISYEEYYKSLPEDQRMQEDILQAQRKRVLNAYNGELEIPAFLKQDLEQNALLNEEALSRSLGTDWRRSTSGLQAARMKDLNRANILSQLQQNEFNQGNTNVINTQNALESLRANNRNYANSIINDQLRLLPSYFSAMQPYMQNRQMGLQANLANASNNLQAQMANTSALMQAGGMNMNYGLAQQQMNAQQNAGLYGGIGSLMGAGLGYAGNLGMQNMMQNMFTPTYSAPSTNLAPMPSYTSSVPSIYTGSLFGK